MAIHVVQNATLLSKWHLLCTFSQLKSLIHELFICRMWLCCWWSVHQSCTCSVFISWMDCCKDGWIEVVAQVCVLVKWHMARLARSLRPLGIQKLCILSLRRRRAIAQHGKTCWHWCGIKKMATMRQSWRCRKVRMLWTEGSWQCYCCRGQECM